MENLSIQDLSNTQRRGDQVISLSNLAFEQLLALGLDLNHIYLLENTETQLNNAKVLGWKQTLVRKGYLDMQGHITPEGSILLSSIPVGIIATLKKKRQVKREETVGDFDRWWDTYPPTSQFTYKGRTFKGSRSLRVSKNECMVKFGSIVESGKYTANELIEALIEEKRAKMEQSLRTGQNQLAFFKGSLVYLNQEAYEGWVQVVRDGDNKGFAAEMQRIDI